MSLLPPGLQDKGAEAVGVDALWGGVEWLRVGGGANTAVGLHILRPLFMRLLLEESPSDKYRFWGLRRHHTQRSGKGKKKHKPWWKTEVFVENLTPSTQVCALECP